MSGLSEFNNFICNDICFSYLVSQLIVEKYTCIDFCNNDDEYKFEYKNVCYKSCPAGTHNSSEKEFLCEEDLICDNYYNYYHNECIHNIPEGYYLNHSILKTIDKCDIKCKSCSLESIQYNLCIECNNNENYYSKDNDNANYDLFINCYNEDFDGYYLNFNTKMYEHCYPSCKKCSQLGDDTFNKCTECYSNYSLENSNCIKQNNIINDSTKSSYSNEIYSTINSLSYEFFDIISDKEFSEDISNNYSEDIEDIINKDSSEIIINDNSNIYKEFSEKITRESEQNEYEEISEIVSNIISIKIVNDNNFNETINTFINDIIFNLKNISYENYYEINLNQILDINEVYNKKDKDIIRNELIKNILNSSALNLIEEKKIDLLIKYNNIIYQFTSTYNQKNNIYENNSIVHIDECENKLKGFYNISENESLIIFLNDIYEEGFLIPIIEYEVYDLNKRNLNLSICKDMKISILHPFLLEDKNLFKYNSSSEYYNDICYVYTSDKKTDIIIEDRRDEFTNNNLSLCEEQCEYKGINIQTKKIECDCLIKLSLSLINEIKINKDKLLKEFIEIKNILNLNIMKCYYILFSFEGFIKNIGNYCSLSVIVINIFLLILFLAKGYKLLFLKIDKFTILINKNKNIKIKETNGTINSQIKKEKKKNKKGSLNIIINNEQNINNIKNINVNISKYNSNYNNFKRKDKIKNKNQILNKAHNAFISNPLKKVINKKKLRKSFHKEIMAKSSSKLNTITHFFSSTENAKLNI